MMALMVMKCRLIKEQMQLEKLLQIIEKKSVCNYEAYYAEKIGVSKERFLECLHLYRKKVDWYRTEQNENQIGKL